MARSRGGDVADDVAKPKSDAYVGLLILSLLAQIAGATFLFLDFSQYPEKAPPRYSPPAAAVQPAAPPPGAPAPGAPAPGAPAPGAPAPMPMPMAPMPNP